MKITKIADLVKGKTRIINQPNGSCFWHKQLCHIICLSKPYLKQGNYLLVIKKAIGQKRRQKKP